MNTKVKVIECPRDAMQGLHDFIPTAVKIEYINHLLQAGFDTIDFGSFVAPAAIPQLKDTAEVVEQLVLGDTSTKLLAIVANTRGAQQALQFPQISYLGFPLSLSETFQKRNTNKSIAEAFRTVGEIQDLCIKHDRHLVIYLSMGFGNPYGDPFHTDYIIDFTRKLHTLNIKTVCPSDTVGTATPEIIEKTFATLLPSFPSIEFGAHFHATAVQAIPKIEAAFQAGCRRFDGAILGFGGCPMAEDELVGNIPTEKLLSFFNKKEVKTGVNEQIFSEAVRHASIIFPINH